MSRESRAGSANQVWPAFVGGLAFLGLSPACLAPFWPGADRIRLALDSSLGAIFASFHPGRVYEPLSWLSYAVDRGLWSASPAGFHLQSLALHAANAVLLYLIAEKLLKDRAWAAAAALLFALHPMRVEVVGWLSARPYLLGSFFSLSSVLFYIHGAADERRRRSWLAASLTAFGLGLAAQPFVAGVPVVLLLLDKMGGEDAVDWGKLSGYWLLLYFFAAISLAARDAVPASGLPALGVSAQLARAVCAPLTALARTLWPFQLSPLLPQTSIGAVHVLAGLFAAAGVTVAAVRAQRREAAAVWLAFLALLLPYALFDQDGVSRQTLRFGDRWAYLPAAALALGLAAGLREAVSEFWPQTFPGRAYAWLLVPLFLGAFTFRGALAWRSPESVLQRNLLAEPDCYECAASLAELSRERGDSAGADRFSAELSGIEIRNRILAYRNDWQGLCNFGIAAVNRGALEEGITFLRASLAAKVNATAHAELGFVYGRKGDFDQAIEQSQAAVALNANDPDVRNNLGFYLQLKGRNSEAIEQYKEALRLAPTNEKARSNLAAALSRSSSWQDLLKSGNEAMGRGASDEALTFYLASIAAQPNSGAYFQAGYLYGLKGDSNRNIEMLRAGVALDANAADARNNLGFYLLKKGQYAEAVARLQEGLRLNPTSQMIANNLAAAKRGLDLLNGGDWQALLNSGTAAVINGDLDAGDVFLRASIAKKRNPNAYFELGYMYSLRGDYDHAIEYTSAAVALDPNVIVARNNLGLFLRQKKRDREAIVQFQEVLKLDPANLAARVGLAAAIDAAALQP